MSLRRLRRLRGMTGSTPRSRSRSPRASAPCGVRTRSPCWRSSRSRPLIESGSAVTLVSWISQTFLQLVLLSIIIVGQNVLAAAADKRSEATYEDADAVLHTSLDIQRHLEAQDAELERILAEVRQLRAA